MSRLDRCFIGVPFPIFHEPSEFLEKSRKEKNFRISITHPKSYHITTHFFGEIDQSLQERIIKGLKEVKSKKFTVSLSKPGFFPEGKPRNARVLYLGIEEGVDQFQDLYKKITTSISGIKFRKRKEFIPHLTVARIRKGDPANLIRRWLNFEFRMEISIERINFYKSNLLPKGSIHTILYSHELGN